MDGPQNKSMGVTGCSKRITIDELKLLKLRQLLPRERTWSCLEGVRFYFWT